jgi:hypothetical protein
MIDSLTFCGHHDHIAFCRSGQNLETDPQRIGQCERTFSDSFMEIFHRFCAI